MTILQQPHPFPLLADGVLSACKTQLWRARRSGCLTVAVGRAWVTRLGDLDDHVLSAGQTLPLSAHDRVVVSPWVDGSPVRLAWRSDQPRRRALRAVAALLALRRGVAVGLLRGAAAVLAALGGRALALARNAEASARRAQGCMALDESSASSGALQ